MADLARLERRLRAAEPLPAPARQPEPQRRRTAVATFTAERDRALADPVTSALKRARLTYDGAGISTQALSILSGISRETLRKAEQDPSSVSVSSLRRLAATLRVSVRDVR